MGKRIKKNQEKEEEGWWWGRRRKSRWGRRRGRAWCRWKSDSKTKDFQWRWNSQMSNGPRSLSNEWD